VCDEIELGKGVERENLLDHSFDNYFVQFPLKICRHVKKFWLKLRYHKHAIILVASLLNIANNGFGSNCTTKTIISLTLFSRARFSYTKNVPGGRGVDAK